MAKKKSAVKKMNAKVQVQQYTTPMKFVHWLMAIMLLSLIFVGWFMTHLANDVPYKYDLYFMHKSFGVIILILLSYRTYLRLTSKVPALDKSFPRYAHVLSSLTYVAFYLLMIAIPVAGILMSQLGGHEVSVFGLKLPMLVEVNKELCKVFNEAHELLAYTLLGLFVLHVSAALKHRYIDKKDVIVKMTY